MRPFHPWLKKQNHVLLILLVPLLIWSCSSERSSDEQTPLHSIHDRPAAEDRFMVTVQLRQPALLATGQWQADTGHVLLNQDHINRVLAEQEEFERKLRHISDKIEVIYRYRLVLNGMSLAVPVKYRQRFREMAESSSLSAMEPRILERLPTQEEDVSTRTIWGDVTSVGFIEALRVHEELGITGKSISVGVIDTGVDYSHKMLQGMGTSDFYQSIDPKAINGEFPTDKVVGGYDFAGSDFDSGSSDQRYRFPKPDPNPLDESGHGTHVAGTIAGLGDGINSYDGVAPDAKVHALKVFGRRGSTNDAVVIAALEYAANPSGNFDLSDRLDVVNLSLGGGFGVPNSLYDIAIQNLTRGGTVAVVAAGNSGDIPYIVGSPSTSVEAISVAASVDAMDHNWRQRASEVLFADGTTELVPMVAGPITPSPVGFAARGVLLHYIGLANQELSDTDKTRLRGRLALIDRGEVSFCEKGERAQAAGAIGFVMINNEDGAPIAMGGDCQLNIPGVMIEQNLGQRLKEEISSSRIPRFSLDPGKWIEYPENVDSMAAFSSRGPRSWDGYFKPEISAPGQAIVSAAVGSGDRAVRMGGTSMAAPHIAGVVALIKQKFPGITNQEIKSRLMNTAKALYQAEGQHYPLARQGAGRVDAYKALTAPLTFDPPGLSLGHVLVDQNKLLMQRVQVKNHSEESLDLHFGLEGNREWTISNLRPVTLGPGESRLVNLPIEISPDIYDDNMRELDGFITVKNQNDELLARIPVLAVLKRVAKLDVDSFQVYSSSAADSAQAFASVKITNHSETAGLVIPMNPLGDDARKTGIISNPARSHLCDLESVGYRVLNPLAAGVEEPILEFGFKLYHPITTWNLCTLAVFLDENHDGIADSRLVNGRIEALDAEEQRLFKSALAQKDYALLSPLLNDGLLSHSSAFREESGEEGEQESSSAAAMETFGYSSLALMRVPLSELNVWSQREIRAQVVVYARSASADAIDVLENGNQDDWWRIPLHSYDAPWIDLPDRLLVRPKDFDWLDFIKGFGDDELLLYFPHNASSESLTQNDQQSLWIRPEYGSF